MSNQSISNVNIPSLQNAKQIMFQQNSTLPATGSTNIPAMQGTGSEQIRQAVDNSYLSNRIKASSDEPNPAHLLGATAASWYVISQAMDKFNPKCAGDYNKSILGKLGTWGDKFSTRTWLGKKIEGGLRGTSRWLNRVAQNNKFVYSLLHHSTSPEWSFAKVPGKGVEGFLAQDAEHIFETFLEPIANHQPQTMGIPTGPRVNQFQRLEQYGMSQSEINRFAERMKGKSFREQALALQRKELDLLGADTKVVKGIYRRKGFAGLQEYARELKVRKLGFKSMKEYLSLKGKFLDNPKAIMTALEKADPNIKVSIGRGNSLFGKIKGHFFGRTASLGEYRNKYTAVLGRGAHTKIGKFLPKALAWFMEGTTNRFAGGKLAVLMQAYIFGDMLVHTIKAPKGEKGKTFIERFANDFTYFLALTAGIVGMHKIGGFKFAGLDEKGKAAYLKALDKFNKNVKAGKYGDKATYKRALQQLNEKLGTKNIKNPITKLFHKIGKFINIGNQRVAGYQSPKAMNLNWLRKINRGNILGVPLRAAIPLAIVSPFLAKWVTKGVHAIFGRPTKSVLDEEPEQEPVQAPDNNTNFQGNPTVQTQTEQPQIQPQRQRNPEEYTSDTNLIKGRVNNGVYTHPENNEVNNIEPDTDEETGEPLRRYIPSPEGVILTAPDRSAAEAALANADRAEAYLQKVLSNK